jgi:hypothetical protein
MGRRKQSECKHGHSLTGWNLYVDPAGRRRCRTCFRAWGESRRRREGQEPRAPWSTHDVERLCTLKESHATLPYISKVLRRSPSAVSKKWWKLKRASGSMSEGFYTAGRVAKLLGVDEHKTLRWVREGWLLAERSGTNRGRGNAGWAVTPLMLETFLENPRFWPLWTVEDIPDPIWRDVARSLRPVGRYVDNVEAGQRLGYAPKHINHLCKTGRLRGVQVVEKRAANGKAAKWWMTEAAVRAFALRAQQDEEAA